jgi:hypothetical protein
MSIRSGIAGLLFCVAPALLPAQTIDNFDGPLDWQPHPSDGVSLNIAQDAGGLTGAAMRLDVDFQGHAGYAIARKPVSIDLPLDYEFTFWVRGALPPNNLEFKLIDASGDNVWWVNQRNFEFPAEWKRVVLKKRHIQFAWGPLGGGEARHIAAIEIVVTAGTGGRGRVWVDDLDFNERHVTAIEQPLTFTRSTIDFPEKREFGGFIVENDGRDYQIQISDDGTTWQTIVERTRQRFIDTPETEARHIRFVPPIRKVTIEPVAWSATPNDFFGHVAQQSARGDYPRYLYGEQSYWTVVGSDDDANEALFNVDGAIEPFKGGFSIEPFLLIDGRLITWNDVQTRPSLARGYLPIPSVRWPQLMITASATASTLQVRYTLRGKRPARLFLAIRPFQVNPSWQFLGVTGGVATIREVAYDGKSVTADGKRIVASARFGAATFDQGNIVDWLRRGAIPEAQQVSDKRGRASAVLEFRLEPSQTATINIPLHGVTAAREPQWIERLNRVTIRVPPAAQRIVDTIRANVAYILIHRDGAALQPGSRSYERSWIRDGAMISDALLRLGLSDVVREYINWYVQYQYADGKVPCCVDSRGADPVPENDSHGELIYLIAEYFRHTKDRALVERVWPHVVGAVNYMDKLRRTQTTPEFFGLLPESISHEGYSAKPMHSYWDDFFAAKGLADAVYLAEALGREEEKKRFMTIRVEFERDLLASIDRSMRMHKIDYIPGSVELGDYDPTSTTIAISPGGQLGKLPASAVARTFDRYFENARARATGTTHWESYTPYELRTVGTFIRLGQPERAHELLDFFFLGQRPPQWRQWAEVVWRDPKTPKFIGDMPHGWVGSDYLRSALDMFAYDRDDGVVVIGAGIQPEWTKGEGVAVRGLRTHHGIVNFTMRGNRVHVSGDLDARGGVVVRLGRKETTIHHLPADVVFNH